MLLLVAYACLTDLCFADDPPQAETLRQLSERKGRVVGAMILDGTWQTAQQKTLVAAEFNAATVGTFWTRTHPHPNVYDWSVTDAAVQWADSQGMGIHLHPLLFPDDRFNPQWVLDSDPADAATILESHIVTAMQRYKGVVDVWDVVNEAVSPSEGYRDTWWLRALGPEYITLAFRIARREDPDAILVYNDHDIELSNSYQSRKWATTQEILRNLHREGLVDALGWQMHTNPDEVLGSQFVMAERMQWVRDELGLKNFITELDMEIPPGDEALERQGEAYEKVALAWLEHSGGGWLQTWGVYDGQSWLGDGKRPLLFDEQYQPKPAYDGVVDALQTVPDKLQGDFNGDGRVGVEDFDLWRQQFGRTNPSAGPTPDADGDGVVDAMDYTIWRDNYREAEPELVASTPEPDAALLLLVASFATTLNTL
ncbi:MAG: endo-1,4-beta-xylanase, partial [Planctomycetota bacterium]